MHDESILASTTDVEAAPADEDMMAILSSETDDT
jgi:hypothetical protein